MSDVKAMTIARSIVSNYRFTYFAFLFSEQFHPRVLPIVVMLMSGKRFSDGR